MKKFLLCIVLILISIHYSFANLTQTHWRWHNNDGSEASATWKADQDNAVSISDYKAIRLRIEFANTTGDTKTMDHTLKYATSTDGPWYTITDNSAINAFVLGGDNAYISHGDPTTEQMTGTSQSFVPGIIITRQDQLTDTVLDDTKREYEWCIKPTEQILAATTYYFKSSAGDPPSTLPALTTTGTAFKAAPAALLTNGGFENDLNNWSSTIGAGSAASMAITQTDLQYHTGAKALAVQVTNPGNANSVSLEAAPVTLQDTGIYILRFWAISDTRNAQLDLNLSTNTTSVTNHYQIYDRFDDNSNGWQMYQYAFHITENQLNIKFQFNSTATYYLDDIELINQKTNPNIDVQQTYNWQNNFNETYGWLSGDNNNPVLLPDGSVAWVYNDSFMGDINPNTNVISSGHIINNLIVKQENNQLQSIYGGTAPNSTSLFSPGNGNLFWQSGGIIENGSLKVLLIEISGGNYTGNSYVGTLSLPDLTPTGLTKLPATIDVSPNCIISDSLYNYIYFGQSSGTYEMHTIVARVPIGQFDSQTPWEYLQTDDSWSTDYSQAKQIVAGVAAGNVLKLARGNYVMSGVPNLSNEIDAWFAPTPYGPWGNKTVIYNIPAQEGILAYEGHLDPSPKDGYYTFTYSVYPFVNESNGSSGSVAMQMAVKSTYLPIYARAKLLALSPYSNLSSPDSLVSLTGQLVHSTVALNWTAATSTNLSFDLQRSTDGINWSTFTSVPGTDSTSLAHYEATDLTPATGLNYYRVGIYNMDNQLRYTDAVQVNTSAALPVGLTYFKAQKYGASNVKLSWQMAQNTANETFIIERSTDNKNFVSIGSVMAADRSSATATYQFVDKAPASGLNYYRLSYHEGIAVTKSQVRSIRMGLLEDNAIRLLVSPNPAKDAIRFSLKNYTGTSFNVRLINMSGSILEQKRLTVNANGYYQLDHYPSSGIYFLAVSADNVRQAVKLIVP